MIVSFIIVQFAPGGPVEQVIAQMSGQNVSSTERHHRQSAGRLRGQQTGQAKDTADVNSTYRGARGLRPEILERNQEAVRLRQAADRALLFDDVELPALRFRQQLLSRHLGGGPDQGKTAGLDHTPGCG